MHPGNPLSDDERTDKMLVTGAGLKPYVLMNYVYIYIL